LERTTLAEEGCGEVTTIDLLEAFGRHFLGWINRWQEDGVKPVQQAWLSRATGLGKQVEIRLGDQVRAGTFEGLSETGAMRLVKDGVAQTIPLDEATKAPTWSI
jgi:biotin-(acetyl-CoA carboxylase) ligase